MAMVCLEVFAVEMRDSHTMREQLIKSYVSQGSPRMALLHLQRKKTRQLRASVTSQTASILCGSGCRSAMRRESNCRIASSSGRCGNSCGESKRAVKTVPAIK